MHRILRRTALLLAITAPALGAQEAKKPAEAHAQHAQHAQHDQHAQHGTPTLDAELTEHFKGIALTEEQVRKVTEIKAKHHKAMDALKKEAKDPNDAALKAALQKHMDAEHAEFEALLTPEQKKVFMENMKAHHKAESAGGAAKKP